MQHDRVIQTPPNHHVITKSIVEKISFSNSSVTRAHFTNRDTRIASIVTARKEVILVVGSVHTPQVLLLSGIGYTTLLKKSGIGVAQDLPGIRQHFQDHLILFDESNDCLASVSVKINHLGSLTGPQQQTSQA